MTDYTRQSPRSIVHADGYLDQCAALDDTEQRAAIAAQYAASPEAFDDFQHDLSVCEFTDAAKQAARPLFEWWLANADRAQWAVDDIADGERTVTT